MPGFLRLALLTAVVLLLGGPFALAEEPEAKSEPAADAATDEKQTTPGHSYHGEAFNEGPRQRAYLMTGTGRVHFPATTTVPRAQQFIDQGVGQLHGFWYLEAERSFRQAAALDPDCAIAYWGMARANINNEKRAKPFTAEAVKRKENATDREKMYIDALDAYYKADAAKKKERAEAYVKALEQIVYKYPDDIEARAFIALQLWLNRGSGSPITSHLAVDALLKQVLEVEPLHPCHHYVIHLWDYEKPELALDSSAKCGPAAPDIAHMWHMPGHIYSRLKRYHDAVWQQEASARVDHAQMIRDRLLPDQIHNFAHNNEWLIRNLISIGRVRDAVELAKNMTELPRHPKYNTLKRGSSYYGRLRLLDVLTRYELWDELIALADTPYLEPTDDHAEQVKRLRTLGTAHFRTGNIEQGQAQLALLEKRLKSETEARDAALAKAEAKVRDEQSSEEKTDAPSESGGEEEKKTSTQDKDESQPEQDAAKGDEELKKKIDKARSDAERPFKAKVETLTKAVDELKGHVAVAEEDYKTALELFKKAGGVDEMYVARVRLLAGDGEQAEKTVRDAVKGRKNEVLPLAHLVALLWELEKRDEAAKAFDELRELSSAIDLDAPPLTRLAPIAAELGHSADWRVPAEPADDIGERPTLDALGPFRWEPPAAPEWTLRDAEGDEHSLGDYRGRPVVVIFYLGYGCLHCVEQLQAFAPKAEEFAEAGISLIAVSTDNPSDLARAHERYEAGEFPFPLLSDAALKVFRSYRAYDDFEKQPLHGTFLIDGDGRVRWQDIGHEPFMDAGFVLGESRRLLALPAESKAEQQ